jgi:hypothetical protein
MQQLCNLAATPGGFTAKFNFLSLQQHSIVTNERAKHHANSIVIFVTYVVSIWERKKDEWRRKSIKNAWKMKSEKGKKREGENITRNQLIIKQRLHDVWKGKNWVKNYPFETMNAQLWRPCQGWGRRKNMRTRQSWIVSVYVCLWCVLRCL